MTEDDRTERETEDAYSIIEFDDFTPAMPVSPREKDRFARRFMTLFVSDQSARAVGSSGVVYRARNVRDELFALKRLRPSQPIADDATPSALDEGRIEAFREEYRTQFVLSNLPAFPQLYGYGSIGSWPAILMEWVEGETLSGARAMLAVDEGDEKPRVPARVVAGIGIAVLDALLLAGQMQHKLVHRDISPNNIILRTSVRSIAEQVLDGSFDVCLIDFGSATLVEPTRGSSFTVTTSMWRGGTPEYGAPEMLTNDIAGVGELRSSPSIDVYALCSVLYELYAGYTPFGMDRRVRESPYRVKMEQRPFAMMPRSAQDAPLVQAILAGIKPQQDDRIPASELRDRLDAWMRSVAVVKPEAESSRVRMPERPAAKDVDPFSRNQGAPLTMAPVGRGGGRAAEDREMPAASGGTGAGAGAGATPVSQPGGVPKRAAAGRTPEIARISSTRGTERRTVGRRAVLRAGLAVAGLAAMGGGAWALAHAGILGGAPSTEDEAEPVEPALQLEELPVGEGSLPFFKARDAETGLWGFVTSDGSWWLEPVLEHEPGPFAQGLAAVADNGEQALVGFIDAKGNWAITPRFADALPFSENLAAAQDEKGRWGFVDTEGAWVVSPVFAEAQPFSQGFAAVCEEADGDDASEGLWGFIEPGGAWAIDPAYREVRSFSEKTAAVSSDGSSWTLIDTGGTVIADDLAWSDAGLMSEGFIAFCNAGTGSWGYANTRGITSIPAAYEACGAFSDGAAPAQSSETGLWGFLGFDGFWSIDPQFGDVGQKRDGLYGAQDASSGLAGYLASDGSWAIQPTFEATDGVPVKEG